MDINNQNHDIESDTLLINQEDEDNFDEKMNVYQL